MKANERRTPKRWTEEEDWILYEETQKQEAASNAKDWHHIAAKLPGRTNKDCRKRWVNKVCGGLKKGAWTKSEDARLIKAVEKHNQRWALAANEVGFRSPDQCAKRWQLKLDPNLEHREWTAEEDDLLWRLVQKHGREWKLLQERHFPRRSTNELKNRYTSLARKAANKYNRPASAASSDGESSANSDSEHSEDAPEDQEGPEAQGPMMASVDTSTGARDNDPGVAKDANAISAEWTQTLDDPNLWINAYDAASGLAHGGMMPNMDMVDPAIVADAGNMESLQMGTKGMVLSTGLSTGEFELKATDSARWPHLVCDAEMATPLTSIAPPTATDVNMLASPTDGMIDSMMGNMVPEPMQSDRGGVDIEAALAGLPGMFGRVVLTIDDCNKPTLDTMLRLANTHKGKSKLEIS
ncbi:Homeodomain-like protein [Xylariaceae sp. FL1019]|nr:Homeodomain-like protein [Xylariaceae sp. FL1019]